MDRDTARALVDGARVARLGTLSKTGRVDLVPMTFALVDDVMYTAVDHKPKRTTELKRLENVRATPEVSVLVDEYDDADWTALWWVRLRGLARVVEAGSEYDDGDRCPGGEVRAVPVGSSGGPGHGDRAHSLAVVVSELITGTGWSAS